MPCATACWRSGRACWKPDWRPAARGRWVSARRVLAGGQADFEGYRAKGVQTLVGWVTLRRAYYACARCGHGCCPLDAGLGVARDSLRPGVRRLACRFGAQLSFADAAEDLAEAARVRLSTSTVRTVTKAVGARREHTLAAEIAAAWSQGLPPATGTPPERLYVAMDGVRILSTDGGGREVKVGVVVPVHGTATAERRTAASYVAGLEPAAAFGLRLALEAHSRGLQAAGRVAVLGDGAEWIWQLAAEHFPHATQIVDWFHASERVWALGRALFGDRTEATTGWVETQLARLAQGQATTLARVAGAALSGRGGHGAPCASDLLHQPCSAHGLRPLSRRRLGHRLRHGGKCLQASHRGAREGIGHALERDRSADRGGPAGPALQRSMGHP